MNVKKVVGIYRGKAKDSGRDFVQLHLLSDANTPNFEGQRTEIVYPRLDIIPSDLKPGMNISLDYNISGQKAYLNGINIIK
ncbi:MAG: hypothetical protein J6A73_04755 [Lachnospiraceae bacterium]|nr:hypothetical protein [Lachnospiraceae bacterium]